MAEKLKHYSATQDGLKWDYTVYKGTTGATVTTAGRGKIAGWFFSPGVTRGERDEFFACGPALNFEQLGKLKKNAAKAGITLRIFHEGGAQAILDHLKTRADPLAIAGCKVTLQLQ